MEMLTKRFIKNCSIGQAVEVETKDALLVGRLDRRDADLKFIILLLETTDEEKEQTNQSTGTYRQFVKIADIKRIHRRRDIDSDNDDNSSFYSVKSERSFSNKDIDKKTYSPCTLLTQFELNVLKTKINSVNILHHKDQNYTEALIDIKAQENIALFVEPAKYGRNFNTAIITVATVNTVYLFDMVSLGELFNDFKDILESERPKKAIHNSRLIIDHFRYQHKVNIKGVFDTLVAYIIVTKEKVNVELEDVVEKFFMISNYFESKQTYYPYCMYRRPLNTELIDECAKRACFVLKLQECLSSQMLSTFYSQCKQFSNIFADDVDSATATDSMQSNTKAGMDVINGLNHCEQSL